VWSSREVLTSEDRGPHERTSAPEAALSSIEVAANAGWSLQIVVLSQHARWESAEAARRMNAGEAAPRAALDFFRLK